MTEYVSLQPNLAPDFWHFSDAQLARSCERVAESQSGARNAILRAEAMRLFLWWREVINDTGRGDDDREHRTVTVSGLRKRTIQILVRLSLQGLLFTPAR